MTIMRSLLLGTLTLAILFLYFPALDLFFSEFFFDRAANIFPLGGHALTLFFKKKLMNFMELFLAIFILSALFFRFALKKPFIKSRSLVFIILAISLSAGLLTNVILKSHWGRARPNEIVEFGGDKHFTAPFLISDQCDKNCSFVSGDASFAFSFLAFALLATRRYKPFAITATLLFATIVSAIRFSSGAHFLSDVLFAGLFTVIIVLALFRRCLQRNAQT